MLIVEDEPDLAEAIRDGLRLEAIAADIAGDGHDGDQGAGGEPPAHPERLDRPSGQAAAGHAAIEDGMVLPARMRFSICRRYAPALRLRACAC